MSSLPLKLREVAMEESNTMRITAKRSSTTRMPKQILANFCSRSPMSSSALKTMVVDDMQSIPPRKREFISSHPKRRPTMNPNPIMPRTMVLAAMIAVLPTWSSFLKENSSPMAKSRKRTPISPHIVTCSSWSTQESPRTYGPTNIPATI